MAQYKRKKKSVIQSHSELAIRLDAIANDLRMIEKRTDEQTKAMHEFEDQAIDHSRKSDLTGDIFIMIL